MSCVHTASHSAEARQIVMRDDEAKQANSKRVFSLLKSDKREYSLISLLRTICSRITCTSNGFAIYYGTTPAPPNSGIDF